MASASAPPTAGTHIGTPRWAGVGSGAAVLASTVGGTAGDEAGGCTLAVFADDASRRCAADCFAEGCCERGGAGLATEAATGGSTGDWPSC
jgi:hypothetical protein